ACSHHPDVLRLVALAAGADLELDLLAGLERAIALALDVGVVDEDVVHPVARDEAVALLGVEELHRADCHVTLPICLNRAAERTSGCDRPRRLRRRHANRALRRAKRRTLIRGRRRPDPMSSA